MTGPREGKCVESEISSSECSSSSRSGYLAAAVVAVATSYPDTWSRISEQRHQHRGRSVSMNGTVLMNDYQLNVQYGGHYP